MTKTVEEVRRAAFEAWYVTQPSYTDGDAMQMSDGQYWYIGTRKAWAGFNAGLDAVEIELPLSREIVDEGGWLNDVLDADEVRAAIEQTGLGLRVK